MMMQLPHDVLDKLLSGYLFNYFLTDFSPFLKITKSVIEFDSCNQIGEQKQIRNYYTWADEDYRNYMIDLLMSLEPMIVPALNHMVNILEEPSQISFINKGKVLVGYEVNNQKYYCI